MEEFKPGQRWVSRSEPELGLGLILETDHRTVTCAFSAAETNRRYAKADAPLVRARFHEGDSPQNPGWRPPSRFKTYF